MEIRKNIYYWKSDRPYAECNVQINDEDDVEDIETSLENYLVDYFGTNNFTLLPGSGQGNHKTYVLEHQAKKYFIRIENGPEKDDYMDVESEIIALIGKIGVPSPTVFHSNANRNKVPYAIQLLNFIDSKDLNELYKNNQLNLKGIAPSIGKYIAAYQQLTFDNFGLFNPIKLRKEGKLVAYHETYPKYFFLNWEEHLAFLLKENFLSVENIIEIKKTVNQYINLLDIKRGCLVHKDLALWNILGTSTEIKSIIDWDDAISGDPVDDISLLACFHSGDIILQIIGGYQSVKPLPDNFEKRFWLHLLRNIIFKSIIRVRGGYFNMGEDFFMLNSNNAISLKDFTFQRILFALEGLKGKYQIKDLS